MTDQHEADAISGTYRGCTFIDPLLSRLSNLLIPAAFAYILTLIQGRLEELRDPCPPLAARHLSLFSQGRNRFTDLIARHPVPAVFQCVLRFVHFLLALLQRPQTEDGTRSSSRFTQQQLLV